MANEAINVEKPTLIVRRIVVDNVAIPKGTIMQFEETDTNLAEPADKDQGHFAGISIEEKVANDGITEIGCALDGVWNLKDGGAGITAGNLCCIKAADNLVDLAASGEFIAGSVVGRVEQTAAGAAVVRVRLGGI